MYLGPKDSPGGERRGGKTPVPADCDELLTPDQLLTLHRVESFGWQLAFVRRPLFQSPVTVITSPEHQSFAVLEADGGINQSPDIVIRH